MEDVHLVEGDLVDVALHVRDAEEVAADVEHGSAPGESRAIDDRAPRHCAPPGSSVGLDGGGEQLAQALSAVEQPRGSPGPDRHPLGGDGEDVCLIPDLGIAVIEQQGDGAPGTAPRLHDRYRAGRASAQQLHQPVGDGCCFGAARSGDHGRRVDRETAARVGIDRERGRDDVAEVGCHCVSHGGHRGPFRLARERQGRASLVVVDPHRLPPWALGGEPLPVG